MATIGIWLWRSPYQFEKRQTHLTESVSDLLPLYCTYITLVGKDVALTSPVLKQWSLVIYSFFLAPALNLVTPAIFLLFIYIGFGGGWSSSVVTRVTRKIWTAAGLEGKRLLPTSSIAPTCGLLCLLAVNVVFLADIEITIYRTKHRGHQGDGEADWTFGQTLALVLLVLPFRDALTYILDLRRQLKEEKRAEIYTHNLITAVQQRNVAKARDAAKYGNVQAAIDGKFLASSP
jgi:hypothetical protein